MLLHIRFFDALRQQAVGDANGYVGYLWNMSFLLMACIAAILLFILFYLWNFIVKGKKVRRLKSVYSTFISEIVIAETPEELHFVINEAGNANMLKKLNKGRLERGIVMQELLQIRKNMSGKAAENISWLYRTIGLHHDSLQKLATAQWHGKAAALQELAYLGAAEYHTLIYTLTHHKNIYVRHEAQVALVKMTGFKGLRFLNTIGYRLTQWQQVGLLQQLEHQADVQPEAVAGWLQSGNETVVEMALKIAGSHKLYALQHAVVACLQHPSAAVQQVALQVLTDLGIEASPVLPQASVVPGNVIASFKKVLA